MLVEEAVPEFATLYRWQDLWLQSPRTLIGSPASKHYHSIVCPSWTASHAAAHGERDGLLAPVMNRIRAYFTMTVPCMPPPLPLTNLALPTAPGIALRSGGWSVQMYV